MGNCLNIQVDIEEFSEENSIIYKSSPIVYSQMSFNTLKIIEEELLYN